MTTDMGPPPPRNPTPTTTSDQPPSKEKPTKTVDGVKKTPMGPPPSIQPIPPNTEPEESVQPTEPPLPEDDAMAAPANSTTGEEDNLPETKKKEKPTKTVDGVKKTPMGPPPSIQPIPPNTEPEESVQPKEPPLPEDDAIAAPANSTTGEEDNLPETKKEQKPSSNVGVAVPYTIPPWSEPPCHNFFLEVLKDGSIIDQFDVYEKGAYMFGRVDLCDFILEHPTISRFHAVLQFNKSGGAFIYDLSSTHGTFINKNQVKKKVYVELHVGDVLRFGHSTRLYIFQGPTDLMPPEKDLQSVKNLKIRQEKRDMEASLLRAKREAALADGISWGMDEDAVEENEDDLEEITWQTFKGQLTEKQEKTREKVLKRLEKIANMKKEIDAIRAKDIAQGGLTQGQQTQIARNEQRVAQVAEELENLEETLNESIRESMGARVGRVHGKKKGAPEDDEDEYMSDEDDFYDRTRKKPSKQKGAEGQAIETADSLLDKKDAIDKQIEEKKKSILDEKNRVIPENDDVAETGDELDAFMSGLSSQLVHDKTNSLQKELDALQSELERIVYLLKIADPTGEASRRRQSVGNEEKQNTSKAQVAKKVEVKTQKQDSADVTTKPKQETADVTTKESTEVKEEVKASVYTVNKPQWLGAVEKKETKKVADVAVVVESESDEFVDYKDRKEVLGQKEEDTGLENAAPGLIIRKRKQVVVEKAESDSNSNSNSDSGVDIAAEDAVALLLKHTRGIQATDDDDEEEVVKKKGKKKKVIGPERPLFLNSEGDYESWVPPEGQSGDGRTSLNDRLGY